MTTDICEVTITASDPEWLTSFTRTLVEERLCACGHNISSIRSIYRWDGTMQDEAEARVALHTRAGLVPRIVQRTNEEHSYEVPCVIAAPLIDGNLDYLDWVRAQTAQ